MVLIGKLYFLKKGVTLNTVMNLELLYGDLEDSFESLKAEVFMHCHTSKEVKQWWNDCAVEYIED